MSTTTPPAEITVPRAFLPPLIEAATLRVYTRCQEAGHDLGCRLQDRHADDEMIGSLEAALDARAALYRALDDGEPVSVAILRDDAEKALVGLRGDLHHGAHSNDESSANQLAETAAVLRDLTAWAVEHDLVEREAVKA